VPGGRGRIYGTLGLELGGKSRNIFFEDVSRGEVCTCLSRALIQKSIHGQLLERAVERAKKRRVPEQF
jgi:aldehyde dehydrogenase